MLHHQHIKQEKAETRTLHKLSLRKVEWHMQYTPNMSNNKWNAQRFRSSWSITWSTDHNKHSTEHNTNFFWQPLDTEICMCYTTRTSHFKKASKSYLIQYIANLMWPWQAWRLNCFNYHIIHIKRLHDAKSNCNNHWWHEDKKSPYSGSVQCCLVGLLRT